MNSVIIYKNTICYLWSIILWKQLFSIIMFILPKTRKTT